MAIDPQEYFGRSGVYRVAYAPDACILDSFYWDNDTKTLSEFKGGPPVELLGKPRGWHCKGEPSGYPLPDGSTTYDPSVFGQAMAERVGILAPHFKALGFSLSRQWPDVSFGSKYVGGGSISMTLTAAYALAADLETNATPQKRQNLVSRSRSSGPK